VARALPARVREAATVLYAFCRVADDAIDDDLRANGATVDRLRARLQRIYRGCPDDEPVDRALAAIVVSHRIPIELWEALLEGMVWDVRGRRYETLEAVEDYAARVAGTVGVMMTLAMGVRDPATLARACDLGVAMQLTNIARDVGEDARRGRIYLPLAWLREAGVDPATLVRRPRPSAGLADVVCRLLDEAARLYHRAHSGLPGLPADCRVAIAAAGSCYAEIGRAVARAGFDSITRRAVVPGWLKFLLLLRAPGRASVAAVPADLAAPPLPATRFLVASAADRPA
jgi:15-cis-phytoene synthase